MLINCDIGERGIAHNIDDSLMRYIDIANIACGGHAGDKESIAYYLDLAKKYDVKVTAHLSYKDKENFGRKNIILSHTQLLKDLDEQYTLIDTIKSVKFHGALYNSVNTNEELALTLASWLKKNGITEVLTQNSTYFDKACLNEGIQVLYEAFIDRRYIFENAQISLSARSQKDAVIHDIDEAKTQYQNFKKGYVIIQGMKFFLKVDTLCIHSDSPSALKILKSIKNV